MLTNYGSIQPEQATQLSQKSEQRLSRVVWVRVMVTVYEERNAKELKRNEKELM